MNSRMSKLRLYPSMALVLLLSACAGKTMVESDLQIDGAPDWVNKGTQYLDDKDGRLLHGVGEAPNMKSASLQKSTADTRARTEVARILKTYMDAATSDYMSAAQASGTEAVSEEAVSQQIKGITKANLNGVKIIARWKDKKTAIIYSLAELDMKHVDKNISLSQKMDENLKKYMQDNSNNIFDKVSQEKK